MNWNSNDPNTKTWFSRLDGWMWRISTKNVLRPWGHGDSKNVPYMARHFCLWFWPFGTTVRILVSQPRVVWSWSFSTNNMLCITMNVYVGLIWNTYLADLAAHPGTVGCLLMRAHGNYRPSKADIFDTFLGSALVSRMFENHWLNRGN